METQKIVNESNRTSYEKNQNRQFMKPSPKISERHERMTNIIDMLILNLLEVLLLICICSKNNGL